MRMDVSDCDWVLSEDDMTLEECAISEGRAVSLEPERLEGGGRGG